MAKKMAGNYDHSDLEQPLVVDGREGDVPEIESCRHFFAEAMGESKKLWYLAGPAMFTSVAQYSFSGVTQIYAGHLSTLELDAFSAVNLVISLLAFGVMVYVFLMAPHVMVTQF